MSLSGNTTVHGHICDICDDNKGMKGMRFKCNTCEDYDLCEKHYSMRSVLHPKHGSFTCFYTKTDKVDTAQKQQVGKNFVICDVCDNNKPIIGARFQCVCCDDYDLCNKCYVARAKFHDKNHKFRMIISPKPLKTEPHRFTCTVLTDKQTYKPGNIVYVRGTILNTFTHEPCSITNDFIHKNVFTTMRVLGPDGNEAFKTCNIAKQNQSVLSATWQVPANIVGGEYTVQLECNNVEKTKNEFFPMAERKFDVMVYSPPRFKKELVFIKKGYGEGENCKAILTVERAEGGFIEKGEVEAICTLDEKEVFRKKYKVAKFKTVFISFKLPAKIKEGKGNLNCIVTEGATESISKTLPIVLKRLDMRVYPESGELISGVKNGVYLEAFTAALDPADFEAVLVEGKKDIFTVKSKHEGKGVFEFTPVKGKKYHLRIVKPEGVVYPVPLPAIKDKGVSLVLKKGKHVINAPMEVLVSCKENAEVSLKLYRKNLLINWKQIKKCKNGGSIVNFNCDYDGVLRLTAFIKDVPVAERVFFVYPKKGIKYDIKANSKSYSPGDKVLLTITPKSIITGKFLPSYVSVTVTDDAVYKMKEKRKRSPSLLESHYLEEEVQELNDANAYIRPLKVHTDSRASPEVAVDLLMGTQFYRRFVFSVYQKEGDKFIEKYPNADPDLLFRIMNEENPERKAVYLQKMDELAQLRKDLKGAKNSLSKAIKERGYGYWGRRRHKRRKRPMVSLVPFAKVPVVSAPKVVKKKEKVSMAPKARNMAPMKKRSMKKKKKRYDPTYFERRQVRLKETQLKNKETEVYSISIGYVRRYEHKASPLKSRKADKRTDFNELLLYESSLFANKASPIVVSFDLNDSITSFRVFIDGYSMNGSIGSSKEFLINSIKSFYIEPKMPLQISFKDKVILPVAVVNNLSHQLKVSLNLKDIEKCLKFKKTKWEGQLKPKERVVKTFEFHIADSDVDKDDVEITLEGLVHNFGLTDTVRRTMSVQPYGFPHYIDFSGTIGDDKKSSDAFSFQLPKDIVMGSLQTSTFVSPSFLGSLTTSLEGLIRCPGGCFEQVSSTLYPMIMATKFINASSGDVDPKLCEKMDNYMNIGYKKLMGYEIKGGGFDWYGRPPANESLSSMGLCEFIQMQDVFPVDGNMIQRTRKWLVSRISGVDFMKNPGRYAYGHAPTVTTNAYIIWSISQCGVEYREVQSVVDNLIKVVDAMNDKERDCYVVALLANALFNLGGKKFKTKSEQLTKLILDKHMKDDGSVNQTKSTITRSYYGNVDIECTSLFCMALLNFEKKFIIPAKRAIDFIMSKQQYGRFGSTQGTALALQALNLYFDVIAQNNDGDSWVEVKLNSTPKKQNLPKEANRPYHFDDFQRELKHKGKNTIQFKTNYKGVLPFSMRVGCKVETPKMAKDLPYSFVNKLAKTKLNEGEVTQVSVEIKNKQGREDLSTMVAIVNLPGGCKPVIEKLKELKKQNKFSHYELWGARGVVFYWPGIGPNDTKKFSFDVRASFPGSYVADPSSCYLYYGDSKKFYQKGLEMQIKAKK